MLTKKSSTAVDKDLDGLESAVDLDDTVPDAQLPPKPQIAITTLKTIELPELVHGQTDEKEEKNQVEIVEEKSSKETEDNGCTVHDVHTENCK